jgi:antitoxin component of MazEF toxin-antitoxin module
MEFTFKGSVMKVGNSLAVNLPKPVVDVYSIKKGDSISLIVTDNGIYIPLTANKKSKNEEVKKLIEKVVQSK